MDRKKVFQFVGYQNSGKTTLIETLIKSGKQMGLEVGTIKHHGHGGPPERTAADKDTDRHRLAGASATAVEGAGSLFIEAAKNKWSLEEMLQLFGHLPLDVVFIEGYKKKDYPKVVLLRNSEDEPLLAELTNIIAVISKEPLSAAFDRPLFLRNETDQFVQWFLKKYIEINED